MGFFGDFFGTLFHGGKNVTDDNANKNAETQSGKITGYDQLNGQTVQIVEDKTTGEKWAQGILGLPNAVSTLWNTIRDPIFGKQDVDEELIGLKYNGEVANEEMKNDFVKKMSEYETLSKKKELTIPEMVYLNQLDADLNNYTVPDTMSNGSLDDGWFGYDSLWGRLFQSDDSRSQDAAKNSTYSPINRESVLKQLNDENRYWNYYGASSPNQEEPKSNIRVMTKTEFKDEKNKDVIADAIDTRIKEAAQTAVDNFVIAPGNPGGRKSTLDEMMGLFEVGLQDRGISSHIEAAKEFYAEAKDFDPVLADAAKDYAVNLVDYMVYALTDNSGRTDQEILKDYIEEKGNPFDFNVLKIEGLSKDAEDLIKSDSGTWVRYLQGGEDGPGFMDGYAVMNLLNRHIKMWKDVDEGDYAELAWNALEYTGATTLGYIGASLNSILGLSNYVAELVTTGEATEADFTAALFGWQNSSTYGYGLRTQAFPELKPDFFGSDVIYTAAKYRSCVDDIVDGLAIAKMDFPVKVGTLEKVNKVVNVTKKLEKAAQIASKTEKVVDAGTDIVKATEKLSKTLKAETFFGRVMEKTKNVFKIKPKVVDLGVDEVLIRGENIARWVAEEAVTSAMFQGMTPYDYSSQDLSMDIMGAVFSGFIRTIQFNNRMGLFKNNAKDTIWAEWYIKEVMKVSPDDAVKILDKLDEGTKADLGRGIRKTMEGLFDSDMISKGEFKSKASKIGKGTRDVVNKLIDDAVYDADQALMKQLSMSSNSKYSSLVNKRYITGANGKRVLTYTWNKPKKMSQAEFNKKIRDARVKTYSAEGLDGVRTSEGRAKRVQSIRKYVKNNLASIAARGGKNARNMVEKVNGKRQFKSDVSKADIQNFYKRSVAKMLRDSGVGVNKNIAKGAGANKVLGIGVQNYEGRFSSTLGYLYGQSRMGLMQTRIEMYINDLILQHKFSKDNLFAGLAIYGAVMQRCFKWWLQRTHNVGDYTDLTESEMKSALREFARVMDERIFGQYLREGESFTDPVSSSKKFMANKTYSEALKENQDLKYMDPETFHSIAQDEGLTIMEKENKLKGFTRAGFDNKTIFSLDPNGKTKHITFNDTGEEKLIFGTEGKISVKVNEDGPATSYSKRMKSKESVNFDKRGLKEYTYRLDTSSSKEGVRQYLIYDDKNVLVGHIKTESDFVNPGGPEDLFGSPRTLEIHVPGIEKGSIDIFVDKDVLKSEDTFIQLHDFNTKLPPERIEVTGRYFDDKMGKEVPETKLSQWNKFAMFIKSGNTNYNKFMKLIPGYTTNVPESYFKAIMSSTDYSASQKMNMLMGMMFNKAIDETTDGIRFDLTKRNTFNRRGFFMNNAVRKESGGWKQDRTYVPGDADIMYRSVSQKDGVVLVKLDGDSIEQPYYYRPSAKYGNLELYKTPDGKKPVGVISFGADRIRGFVKDGTKNRMVLGSVEFLDRSDEGFVQATISKRYGSKGVQIKVDGGDEMYREIYKALNNREMSDAEFLKVKNTPNMTPSKYLETEIRRMADETGFGKYFTLRKGDWKDIVNQFNQFKVVATDAGNYKKIFKGTQYSDRVIFRAAERYNELYNASGKTGVLNLSKADKEMYNIIVGGDAKQYGKLNVMTLECYKATGQAPVEGMFAKEIKRRLDNRRNAILSILYKGQDVSKWNDVEKQAMLSQIKRISGRYTATWADISIEDLGKDIEAHPDEYSAIAKRVFGEVSAREAAKEAGDAKDLEIINEGEKKLNKLEGKVGKRPTRTKSPDQEAIQLNTLNAQRSFLTNKLEFLENQKTEAMNAGDEATVTALNREIQLVNDTRILIDENLKYKQTKLAGGLSEKEWQYLVNSQLTGRNVYEAGNLAEAEINARVQRITDSIPGCKVLEYDPETGTIKALGLTDKEQLIYADTLNAATNALKSGKARAAHLSQIHSIVINPRNVSTFDMGHEWFHEASSLVMDRERIRYVYDEAYEKFGKQIEEFAANRGYGQGFESELLRRDAIVEEWLAERFGEYVQGRISKEISGNKTILQFFEQLWERIKMMFSNTEIIKLFDDIYAGKKADGTALYNKVEIDLKPEQINNPNYRLTDDYVLNAISRDNPLIGDATDYQALRDQLGFDNAAILVNKNFAGRGNYFTSMNQVVELEDGRLIETSYDKMYEAIMKKEKEAGIDEAIKFLYGSNGDFYRWISEKTPGDMKSIIVGGGALELEVHYPRVGDGSVISEFKLTVPKGGKGMTDFVIDDIRNVTQEQLARVLSSMGNTKRGEYDNIIKAFQTYGLNAEAKQMANIPIEEYNTAMSRLGPQYYRFVTKDMPDVLEKSIDTYIHSPRHAGFDGYKNIDQIEGILNKAYRNILFDRHIQHTEGNVNGVLTDIHNSLFQRKWDRTLEIINDINTLGDDHLTWSIGRGRVFTVTFTDDLGESRSIGWHMSPNNFQQLIDEGLWKGPTDGDLPKLDNQIWYKSMLIDAPGTHYRNGKTVGMKPSEAIRRTGERKNISFRNNIYSFTDRKVNPLTKREMRVDQRMNANTLNDAFLEIIEKINPTDDGSMKLWHFKDGGGNDYYISDPYGFRSTPAYVQAIRNGSEVYETLTTAETFDELIEKLKGEQALRPSRVIDSEAGETVMDPSNKTYYLGGTVFSVDGEKGFLIQKNMDADGLRGFLENGKGISSSVAINQTFVPKSWYGEFALLGNKLSTKGVMPFEDISIFSNDAWTPRLDDVLVGYIDVQMKDILSKYDNPYDKGGNVKSEIKKKINKIIHKEFRSDLDYRQLVDDVQSGMSHAGQNISFTVRYTPGLKSTLVRELLNNPKMVDRIFDESIGGNLVGFTDVTKSGNPDLMALKLMYIDDLLIRGINQDNIGKLSKRFDVQHINDIVNKSIVKDRSGEIDVKATSDKLANYSSIQKLYQDIGSKRSFVDFASALIVYNNGYKSYLEGYSKYLKLSDYWGIATHGDDNFSKLTSMLDEYKYKYYVIEDLEGMTAKDFEKVIDEYVKGNEKAFIVFKYDEAAEVTEGSPLDNLRLVDRRTSADNTVLDDKTLSILHKVGLDGRVTDISEQKYVENMRNINKVLSDYNYNMKKDAPSYYEEKQKINKKYKVREEQTWNNSKRRILDKEYRDTTKRVREAKKRMEIRQAEFDEFKQSPVYYQATKLKEALDANKKAKNAIKNSIKKTTTIVPEKIQSYKPTKQIDPSYHVTTDSIPPYADELYNPNMNDIDNDTMRGAMLNRGTSIRSSIYVNESQILKQKVDVCVPVGKNSLNDPDLLDKPTAFAESLAIWATDSDVLNKFKAKMAQEYPEYERVYDRPNSNVSYYRLKDDVAQSDEVKIKKNGRDVELEKQIEEDKTMNEAVAGSVSDSSLLCNI